MSGESRKGAAKDQDQMKDQEAFREDPRGSQEVSEQQPETQPSGDGGEHAERSRDQNEGGESGRDDPGQATGDPANAG